MALAAQRCTTPVKQAAESSWCVGEQVEVRSGHANGWTVGYVAQPLKPGHVTVEFLVDDDTLVCRKTLRPDSELLRRSTPGPLPGDAARFGRQLRHVWQKDPIKRDRQIVFRETLTRLGTPDERRKLRAVAAANLSRWAERASLKRASRTSRRGGVRVIDGDWGEVAKALTMQYGKTFAVLNMASATWPGGHVIDGMAGQEEDMFCRTDCHFCVSGEFDRTRDAYRPLITRLLNAEDGRALLDIARPRVCLRGPEAPPPLYEGPYDWLFNVEIFPFFELRAAAVDLRKYPHKSLESELNPFDAQECERRVEAQLDTLIDHDVRHAVLGAFGCGAYQNPPREVANAYASALAPRLQHFDVVAFAIPSSVYGPDVCAVFSEVLEAVSASVP